MFITIITACKFLSTLSLSGWVSYLMIYAISKRATLGLIVVCPDCRSSLGGCEFRCHCKDRAKTSSTIVLAPVVMYPSSNPPLDQRTKYAQGRRVSPGPSESLAPS